jgi:hypothetical protein
VTPVARNRRRTTWWLGGLSVLFVVAFCWQRSRSAAARVLDHRARIEAQALAAGLDPELGLALCWERGGVVAEEPVAAMFAEFQELRVKYGAAELAMAAFAGHQDVVVECLRLASGDRLAALARLQALPERASVVRLRAVGKRLAALPRRQE